MAGKERISELKVQIQSMGHVNVSAIQELEVEQGRYDDLVAQMDDLQKAESDLKNALGELEGDIQSRFTDGMEQINDNFKVISANCSTAATPVCT